MLHSLACPLLTLNRQIHKELHHDHEIRITDWGDFWKYRLGDIRIIASIEDDRLVILVLRVGNRKEIYRR